MSDRTPQFTVSHLVPAPFVQQVARALYEAGMLRRFVCTLANEPDSRWQGFLSRVAGIAGFDLKRQLGRRSITEIPLDLVETKPFADLFRLVLSRVDRDRRPTDVIFHWMRDGFDRTVAGKWLNDVEGIYGYEYGCRDTFEEARRRGLFCVYDVPSPEHDFTHRLLNAEIDYLPELNTPYARYCRKRQDARTAWRKSEYDNAHIVIANSEFTKNSFAETGWKNDKVRVIPYGAPPPNPQGVDGGSSGKGPLNILWAGTFNIRKGAHYLIEAWKKLSPAEDSAVLDVYGAVTLPDGLLAGLPQSLRFHGSIPRSELYEVYRRADVLVFPTLCDGFGMVVTEALSQGLPVLTTQRAGACDLIDEKRNGLIVPAADSDSLAAAIEWCRGNREELRSMREAALQKAAGWQWEDYRRRIAEVLMEEYGTVQAVS